MATKNKMQAPRGTTAATIEGHEYDVPASGVITLISDTHIETLKRHGFTEILEEAEDIDSAIDSMDKDQLVEFIEERGGDADNSMSVKKLRRIARETAGLIEA